MTQTDKQAHTPGPWQVSPASVNTPFSAHSLAVIRREGGYIARAIHRPGTFRPEAEANARLIAAAPDLLATSEEMMSMLEDQGSHIVMEGLTATMRQRQVDAFAAVLVTIAKAKGETP